MSFANYTFPDLRNKTAIVTGGAQGLGEGIVRAFVSQGTNVVIADIDEVNGVSLIESINGSASFFRSDLTREQDVDNLLSYTIERYGQLNFIINNARPKLKRPDVDQPAAASFLDDWDLGINLLLRAPCLMIKKTAPFLSRSKAAAIVNISSTNSRFISAQPLIYHISKAALDQMTRYAAVSLAPVGIRVNAVSPGIVEKLGGKSSQINLSNLGIVESIIPLRRPASVNEVAAAVLFLCSEGASSINGEILTVDGGMTLVDHFEVARNNRANWSI